MNERAGNGSPGVMCLLREEEMCFIQSKSCWMFRVFQCSKQGWRISQLVYAVCFLPLHHLHEGKFCILNILINCKNILNWVQLWCPFLDLGKMSRINVSCVMGQQSLILQGRDWKSLLSRLWRDCELLGLYKEVHSECVSRAVKYVTWQSSLKHLSLSGIGFDRDCLCK